MQGLTIIATQHTTPALQKFSPADYGLYHQVLSCDDVMQKLTTQTLDDDKIKRAFDSVIATAKTTHIRQLYATVSKQNTVSQHILAKFGFIYRYDEMIDDMDGEYWELDF